MTEKGYLKSWRFCEECQNVVHKSGDGSWPACNHDWRPNSPAGVLSNQKKELELFGPSEQALFQLCARTYQSPIEIFYLVEFIRKYAKGSPIRTIVEIGSYHGGTADFFDRYFMPEMLICIDLNFEHWTAPQDIAHRIEGDTRDARTLEDVKIYLNNEPVDFLFIDGDHSIDGARNDWEKYSPLVRNGGVIAFHDTGAIPAVRQVFEEVPGSVKINIVSYQGIGIVIKQA